jgi:hypothetical protein
MYTYLSFWFVQGVNPILYTFLLNIICVNSLKRKVRRLQVNAAVLLETGTTCSSQAPGVIVVVIVW